ncbi:pantoate--beta-alanine ligase [Maribacter sp. 4U21]|uniref:pantoate--beta-alanine ligase n=1 Tax=Maribacter sp. 4U21 TaxID=1889779 RepID=UPI000C15B9A7|nr:pantoate--beta-alanine ligase [Maribacter sp. 4U21]PIB27264.1 pantoate--beta-alanine ligase [Maribacter sp. 4U21]
MLPVKTKKELLSHLKKLSPHGNLGLVPTMGALHQGHASLIKKAISENEHVVVTIFVNPTQFDNSEDLKKYPSTLSKDLELVNNIAPKITVFAPSIQEIYDDTVVSKTYDFHGLDKVMEGEFRDDHFNGVGTIVETLLRLIKPTKAYFGEKDFQQLRIIQKLTEIEKIPVEIVPCPIVREPHGLAMSSRNERLDAPLRLKASLIYSTLKTAKEKFGTESASSLREWVSEVFQSDNDFKLEYFDITDVETLTPIQRKQENIKYRAFIAVYAAEVRLIDNIALN